MIRKFLLLIPIISSLVFTPTAGALTLSENEILLDGIIDLATGLPSLVDAIRVGLEKQRTRGITSEITEGALRRMNANLANIQNALNNAKKISSSKGELSDILSKEYEELRKALKNILALSGEAYSLMANGLYYEGSLVTLTNISYDIADLIRNKLNSISAQLGGIKYEVGVRGSNDKGVIVTMPGGDLIHFPPGVSKQSYVSSSNLPKEIPIVASFIGSEGSRAATVSVAPALLAIKNCSVASNVSLDLSAHTGSVVVDGATGNLVSVVASGYQQPIALSIDLGSGGESNFEDPAMAKILDAAPALLMITGSETGILHIVDADGESRKLNIYDDSNASFSKFYDKLGIKNLNNFLTLPPQNNPEMYQLLSVLTNMEERSGLGLFLYQANNDRNVEVYAKLERAGSYEKVYESPADKLSIGYTAEGGANIFISDKELTQSEADKLLGESILSGIREFFGGGDKPSYDIGYKLLSPGWLRSSNATGLTSGIKMFNLALAQDDVGSGLVLTAGDVVTDPPNFNGGSPNTPSDSDNVLLGGNLPNGPSAQSDLGGSNSKTTKNSNGSVISGALGLVVKIKDNGEVTFEPVNPENPGGSAPSDVFRDNKGDNKGSDTGTIDLFGRIGLNPELIDYIKGCIPNPYDNKADGPDFGSGTTIPSGDHDILSSQQQTTGADDRTIPTNDGGFINPPTPIKTPGIIDLPRYLPGYETPIIQQQTGGIFGNTLTNIFQSAMNIFSSF